MGRPQTDVRISAEATPSIRQQRHLLTLAHEGAPGWPALLPQRQRVRGLAGILSGLPRAATCRVTAWDGSRLVGLLLAETNRGRSAGLAQRLWHSWHWPARMPDPLRRLLASPAYQRPTAHDGYVLAVAVHPDWQGQHIGLRLVQTLCHRDPALTWLAHTDHAGSQALFQRAGFEGIMRIAVEGLTIHTVRGSGPDITRDCRQMP